MDKNEIITILNNSNYRHVKNSRIRLKEKLVEYKGGKCEICGYNKCIVALDFHHLDPKEKDFNVSSYSVMSYDKLKDEVDKCILVCSNCHREIHYNEVKKKQIEEEKKLKEAYKEILQNREEYVGVKIKDSYKYLIDAGIMEDIQNNVHRKEIFKKYHINNKTFNKFLEENNITYCKRKIVPNRPNKEELLDLLSKYSKSAIAKMFGVSFNAVHKWCKKYQI